MDNQSTDDSGNRQTRIAGGKVEILRTEKNGRYGYGNNFRIRYLMNRYQSEYIVISNPDVSFSKESICECLCFLQEHPNYIAVVSGMSRWDGEPERDPYCAIPFWNCLFWSTMSIM